MARNKSLWGDAMSNLSVIRLLLADDHVVMRAGLRLLIDAQPDMETIGEAEDGLETLILAKSLNPDVILLDLSMPHANGLSIMAGLKKQVPQAHVLVLTMHEQENYLREALRLGASGYVVKSAADQELINAIRAVVRDEIYIHPSMTRSLLEGIIPQDEQGGDDPWILLSEREQQVIRRVAQGYTNRVIAESLQLSIKTIETYRARAMEKLKIQSRSQLVRYAVGRGLLEPDPCGE